MKDLPNLPDFALQLSEEKAKALKLKLSYINTEHTEFCKSLYETLNKYDQLVSLGYKPLHEKARTVGVGFSLYYLKPDNILKAEQQKAINTIEAEFLEKENQLKVEYLEYLLGEELAEKEAEKLKEMEKEKALLKEKLLSTLFQ